MVTALSKATHRAHDHGGVGGGRGAAAAAAAAIPDTAEQSDDGNTENIVVACRHKHKVLRPPQAQQQ